MQANLFFIKVALKKKENDFFAPVLELFPNFDVLLAHVLVLRLGMQAKDVEFTKKMSEFDEQDCRRVGMSMATFMREFEQGETAVAAWKLHYTQLNILFDEDGGKCVA